MNMIEYTKYFANENGIRFFFKEDLLTIIKDAYNLVDNMDEYDEFITKELATEGLHRGNEAVNESRGLSYEVFMKKIILEAHHARIFDGDEYFKSLVTLNFLLFHFEQNYLNSINKKMGF